MNEKIISESLLRNVEIILISANEEIVVCCPCIDAVTPMNRLLWRKYVRDLYFLNFYLYTLSKQIQAQV